MREVLSDGWESCKPHSLAGSRKEYDHEVDLASVVTSLYQPAVNAAVGWVSEHKEN